MDVNEQLKRILAAAENQRGRNHSDELRDALNAAAAIPPEEREGLPKQLADSLAGIASPAGAGLLAIWLGAAVEGGMSPDDSLVPILDKLLDYARAIYAAEDEEDADWEPSDEVLIGLELLGQSLVAHLLRRPERRAEIRQDADIMEVLDETAGWSIGVKWVLELLRQCTGELVVLHIESRTGVRVVYENIANCFHLFTLLQCALEGVMLDAYTVSDETRRMAFEGGGGGEHDAAWWHYGQGCVPRADFSGMVYGEMTPASIIPVEGEQVLLLWPRVLKSRSWDTAFFGPIITAMPPNVFVKNTLSAEEVDYWWGELNLPR